MSHAAKPRPSRARRAELSAAEAERALVLLRRAVSAATIAAVARRLGYSRPALSRLLSGTYGRDASQLLATALTVLDAYRCPFLGVDVSAAHCMEINTGPAPTWDPSALAQRQACRRCPNFPEES